MQDECENLHGCLHGIKHIMLNGHLHYFQKLPLGGKLNTKPRDHGTMKSHNHWFIIFYHVQGPRTNRDSLKDHMVEGPVTYDFTLHLRNRDQTT